MPRASFFTVYLIVAARQQLQYFEQNRFLWAIPITIAHLLVLCTGPARHPIATRAMTHG